MNTDALDLVHTVDNDLHVITVSGELDIASHHLLRSRVREILMAGPAHILIDLSAATFLDSIALGTLIGARRRAHTLRGSFGLVLGEGVVQRVFAITDLEKVFTIHADPDAWRDSLRRRR